MDGGCRRALKIYEEGVKQGGILMSVSAHEEDARTWKQMEEQAVKMFTGENRRK